MTINRTLLSDHAQSFGVTLDADALDRFELYARLLLEWNKKFNLTAITEPDAVVIRHFVDSLLFFTAVNPSLGDSLIDVGSGAGFPGIPVKIARPDMKITLLDSTNKRITFLNEVSSQLGLDVTAVHSRAEDAAQLPELREKFDFATARAVAHMRELSEYCLGFVKVGGQFVALKGPSVDTELLESKRALTLLGGEIADCAQKNLPDSSTRTLVVINKRSQTPTAYPRKGAKIAKFPLI